MLQPVNALVAEFGRASAAQTYPHQAFKRSAQNHHESGRNIRQNGRNRSQNGSFDRQ